MQKVSFTTLVAVVLAAGLGYLAFKPDVARDVVDWVRTQFGGPPDPKMLNATGYTPVIPGR